jgi:hypothetical protein
VGATCPPALRSIPLLTEEEEELEEEEEVLTTTRMAMVATSPRRLLRACLTFQMLSSTMWATACLLRVAR